MSKDDKNSGHVPQVRMKATRVKSKASRSVSSTAWLNRQLNDPYVAAAKKAGYRSRAAFKLLQLNERFKLLRAGMRIVDLGAAPGGWSQVAAAVLKGKGQVVALDILDMPPLEGVTFFHADFMADESPAKLIAALQGKADLVLSDMAAPTTGHSRTDHIRIMALADAAYDFAAQVLAPNGAFVCKLFQGGAEKELLDRLKQDFAQVRHAKPAASRAESSETYVVAIGFKGA
ncbi:MAG: RlmE family RNA methyltransferase [Alphaproteobacteria bacterium]|nr:RlmE family RNA methyltransferase [Alphaproteobacteria bacterium]